LQPSWCGTGRSQPPSQGRMMQGNIGLGAVEKVYVRTE
jgi:hypothetical protein